jgi:hypothetical protein
MGNEINTKGFGGLSDLKTDIDSILEENEVKFAHQSTEITEEPIKDIPQANSNERKVYQNPELDDSSKTNPLWWWFIGGAILFFIVVSNSNNSVAIESPPVAEEAPAPVAEEAPAPVAEEAPAPVASVYSPEEQFYIQPSVGRDNILSVPEIRYCLANDIKIKAIQENIDATSNSQIDKLNELVNDYNARCESYRYRIGDDSTAASDVEQERQNIIHSALNDFF